MFYYTRSGGYTLCAYCIHIPSLVPHNYITLKSLPQMVFLRRANVLACFAHALMLHTRPHAPKYTLITPPPKCPLMLRTCPYAPHSPSCLIDTLSSTPMYTSSCFAYALMPHPRLHAAQIYTLSCH